MQSLKMEKKKLYKKIKSKSKSKINAQEKVKSKL